MPLYKCEFCKFQTEKKTDFQRHKDRKVPCTLSQLAKRESELESKIETIVEERLKAKELLQMAAAAIPEQITEIKTITEQVEALAITPQIDVTVLMTLNKRLHNMIRNYQGNLKSDKIHHDISRMFFYVFAQNFYDTRLSELLDPRFYVDVDGFEECYLKLLKINEILASENEVIEHNLKNLWKKVLAQHYRTKPAFIQTDFFNIQPQLVKVCLFEIYKTIKDVNFDMLNEDFKGKIFEYYVNDYCNSNSNDFGAYFTPRHLIKATLSLMKTLYPGFAPLTAYDPCMGTAGFLTEAYRAFKSSIDCGYIYGNELEPDTYTSAYMNMLLSAKPPAYTWCIDSFIDTTPNKFQLIVTNPPFGVDTNYDKIVETCNEKYKADPTNFSGDMLYPVKTNDGSALFLQHCMAKLAKPGVCSIVLPNGEILTKAGAFGTIRQNLMANFYIMSIVTVPGGTFTNTNVKTIILTFANIGCPTQSIKFYDYVNREIKFQEEIPLTKIIEKKYNWRYAQYRPFESIANASYPVVKLGDICSINNGKSITKAKLVDGPYPVIGGGKDPMGMHNEYNVNANVICIARKGTAGYVQLTTTKSYMHENVYYLDNYKDIVNYRYVYYYLQAVQDQIYNLVGGSGSPGISKTNLAEIPVPIAPIEKQTEIANMCDEIDAIRKTVRNEIKAITEHSSKIIPMLGHRQFMKTKFTIMKLKDICDCSNGQPLIKANYIPGEFPVYGGGMEPSGMHNSYNVDENTITVSKDGTAGFVNYTTRKTYLTNSCMYLHSYKFNTSPKFIYYYLKSIQEKIFTLRTGLTIPHVKWDIIGELEIPFIESAEQVEFIERYENTILSKAKAHQDKITEDEKYIELLDNQIKELFM